MKIQVICVGKLRDQAYLDRETHYRKRLSHFGVERIQINDGKSPYPRLVLDKEAASLEKRIGDFNLAVLLDEKGESFTSLEFSKKIESWQTRSLPTYTFVLGSAYGVQEKLKRNFIHKIRLSDMTLPHDLARIVFLEQLYRAFQILAGTGYHH